MSSNDGPEASTPKKDDSHEPDSPALPARPTPTDGSPAHALQSASLSVPNATVRPKLQGRPTTAVSRTDIHTQLPTEDSPKSPHPRSRAASVARSVSRFNLRPSRAGSVYDENASLRSYRSGIPGGSGALESLFGDIFSSPNGEQPETGAGAAAHDTDVFAHEEEGDLLFRHLLDHEFDDLESLEADESNEESLISRWRLKLKHYLILSSAGKPIYSRHGDDMLISNSIGIVQTIISLVQAGDDTLKAFTAGDARFVVQSKGHLHLLAISRLGENDAELRNQLEALYMQILSTLTLPNMERMFLNRPSTDLRRPLEGTESLLSALADDFTRGSPSNLLSALECLKLRKSQREIINRTMVSCKTPDLLYGLVVAGGRLVSVLRPKKHSLHPGDLHLIFNMLFKAEGVRAGGGENWIPICLPGFNNTGYLYMYVSFLDHGDLGDKAETPAHDKAETLEKTQDDIVIVLISTKKESFYELRQMRDDLVQQFKLNGSLQNVQTAVRSGRPACTDIVPGTVLRHFLYKSRANVQFIMPSEKPHFGSAFGWRKLMSLYSSLHAAVHAKTSPLKVHHSNNDNYVSLAWITPLFEIYCVASPTAGRTALAQGATKLEQWARREEERLFIVGGAVF